MSNSGCHDNRMDKIWWNEQWMGWPIGPHYAASSNVDNAHKLKGQLMLLVPEMDTNVDPASTMQVVDALIRAGKTSSWWSSPARTTAPAARSARASATTASSSTCSASIRRTGIRRGRTSRRLQQRWPQPRSPITSTLERAAFLDEER